MALRVCSLFWGVGHREEAHEGPESGLELSGKEILGSWAPGKWFGGKGQILGCVLQRCNDLLNGFLSSNLFSAVYQREFLKT